MSLGGAGGFRGLRLFDAPLDAVAQPFVESNRSLVNLRIVLHQADFTILGLHAATIWRNPAGGKIRNG
jgi:hypothetical protein